MPQTKEELVPMDSELHPIGTLMYEEHTLPDTSSNWKPYRIIWRVIAHRECQEYPFAPVKLACEIELVRSEDLCQKKS